MGEAMKYFLKKLLGHEIFRSMVSWATNFFEKLVKPSGFSPTYLMYAPLMQEFVKASLLVLHYSKYRSMTFLMMLSVILLSMLKILLSTVSVTRHLICGNKQSCLLNFNLINETLQIGLGKGFFILIQEKFSLFCLTSLITLVLLM